MLSRLSIKLNRIERFDPDEGKEDTACADLGCMHSYYLQAERILKAAAVTISSATSRVVLPSVDKTESGCLTGLTSVQSVVYIYNVIPAFTRYTVILSCLCYFVSLGTLFLGSEKAENTFPRK